MRQAPSYLVCMFFVSLFFKTSFIVCQLAQRASETSPLFFFCFMFFIFYLKNPPLSSASDPCNYGLIGHLVLPQVTVPIAQGPDIGQGHYRFGSFKCWYFFGLCYLL